MTETPPPTPPAPAGPMSEAEERSQAKLLHILNGFFPAIGALIFWLIGKDKSEFQKDQATEALNFSIVATVATIVTCGLGYIAMVIFAIMGGMAANKGEAYRYPYTYRLIK